MAKHNTSMFITAPLMLGFLSISPAQADADPTVDQIYRAFRAGHLAQAQMMWVRFYETTQTARRLTLFKRRLTRKKVTKISLDPNLRERNS